MFGDRKGWWVCLGIGRGGGCGVDSRCLNWSVDYASLKAIPP